MAKKRTPSLADVERDVVAWTQELNRESDRGAVLISAAYLENMLDVMLRAHFVDDIDLPADRKADSLIGVDRPLASFSAKIRIAFFVGIIGPNLCRDLDTVRRIRNEFAHSHANVGFDRSRVRDLCANLSHPVATQVGEPRKLKPSRYSFVVSVCSLLLELHKIGSKCVRLPPAEDLPKPRLNTVEAARSRSKPSTSAKQSRAKKSGTRSGVRKRKKGRA